MARLFAASNGSTLEHVYTAELESPEQRARDVEKVIAHSRAVVTHQPPRRAVLEELDVESFWTQPDRVINQTLHIIVGQWRLVVKNKEIVGYARPTRRTKRGTTE